MRWQTVLRLIIATGGIAVAAVVFMQLQDRPVDAPSEAAPLADPTAISESEKGVFEVFGADGTPSISIRYGKKRDFADGRREFDDVTTVFMRAGVSNRMSAAKAVATGRAGPTGEQPEQIVFTGDVKLSAVDGMSVEADGEATFFNTEQKTVIPGAMRFTRGRLSGSGVGADLYMDRSVLWIHNEAQLSVAPELEGGTPIQASAKTIGLADADHFMRLEGDAVITHQSKRLSANNAMVSFSAVGDVVQYIELRGQSAVRSTGDAAAGRNLTADDINLTFAPDTGLLTNAVLAHSAVLELQESGGMTQVKGSQIDLFVGPDGTTLTKLQAADPVEVSLPRQGEQPATLIRARTLLADGDAKAGLTRAVFTGGVNFRETRPGARGQAAAARVATAETLALGLKGDLGQVENARFQQNFRVEDGDLIATAAEGIYDGSAETLELRSPQGAVRPKAESPDITVIGNEIDINLKTDAFDARGTDKGRVESTLSPSTTADAKSKPDAGAGLFERGKAITGTSDRLEYRRGAGTIVYEGGVFLLQGDSRLFADAVRIDDKSSDLTATGTVRSTLTLAEKAGATAPTTKPKPTRVSANALVYTDSARTAVYSGAAVLDTSSGEQIRGERITLTLEQADRALRSAEAVAAEGGEVRVALLEGRQTAGQRVVYDAATDKYRVHGTPAILILPDAERGPGECSIGSGTTLDFARTEGSSQKMTGEGGFLGTMKPVKCAAVMKVIK
jgi:lipopolysaccharide export system protein LptA